MSKFDYSRPLYKKVLVRHPTKAEAISGVKEVPIMEIGMYLDEPGVFYDNQGNQIDERTATQPGGFTKDQVARFSRFAEKRRQIAEIEAKFAAEIAEVEAPKAPKSPKGDTVEKSPSDDKPEGSEPVTI